MISGKTKTGFEFNVDSRVKNDWRVLRSIADIQSKDKSTQAKAVVQLIQLIIGEREEELLQHIAENNDGFVPAEVVYAEISDILGQIPAIKN